MLEQMGGPKRCFPRGTTTRAIQAPMPPTPLSFLSSGEGGAGEAGVIVKVRLRPSPDDQAEHWFYLEDR